MNCLDILIFACNMYELPRYMHVVAYHMNELFINIWSLFIRLVNIYRYLFEGQIYIYIYAIHVFRG